MGNRQAGSVIKVQSQVQRLTREERWSAALQTGGLTRVSDQLPGVGDLNLVDYIKTTKHYHLFFS